MTEKTVRFVHIYHPAYLGGDVYAISQPHLHETAEKSINMAINGMKEGRLMHDCIQVEWTADDEETVYTIPEGYTVPEGCIVRFMNVERPNHIQPDSFVAGQVGLYATAEEAKAQAERINLGFWMERHYIAVAVPVIFKGLPMADGWVRHDRINYNAVHREELRVVDMTPTSSY